MTFPDGDSYVGEWKDGNMNGWGAYYWNNGNSYQVSDIVLFILIDTEPVSQGKGHGRCHGRPGSPLQVGRWIQVHLRGDEGLHGPGGHGQGAGQVQRRQQVICQEQSF